jgi:predicted PurR-regulated permease PerM
LLIAAGILLVVCLYLLRSVLWPFIFAFFIAYIFDPWVDFLQRKGVPRIAGIFIVFAALILVIVLISALVVPQVAREASDAAKKFPQYGEVLRQRTLPWVKQLSLDHPEIAREIENYYNTNLKQKLPQLLTPLFAFLGYTFSGVVNFLLVMLNLLLVPVLAFYLLKDFQLLKDRFMQMVPPRHVERVRLRFVQIDEALSEYLRGQLTVSFALGFIYTIGLLILRVPLAIPIGIFSGLANMVPYLGFVLGISASMLLSFLDNQQWQRIVWIIALYAFAQLNEGTWIGPLAVGKRTGLHPVLVMLALVIGGTLFGFMGMVLAVPFVAVASVFVKDAYENYLTSTWYGPAADERAETKIPEGA